MCFFSSMHFISFVSMFHTVDKQFFFVTFKIDQLVIVHSRQTVTFKYYIHDIRFIDRRYTGHCWFCALENSLVNIETE